MKRILLSLLLTVIPLLGGEINTLTLQEKVEGWKLLFNGEDLENWRQYRSEKPPRKGWQIEEGILTKKQNVGGGQIVTRETYDDYILTWEWRITKNGNSGIKYLVSETESRRKAPGPEYQLIDNDGPEVRKGRKHETACLYDIIAPDENHTLNPVGEWNSSKIVVAGNQVEHWLNGKKVVSYELGSPEFIAAIKKSKFRGAEGFGEKIQGHIMLTDHNSECSFRNMKILVGTPE